MCFVKVFQKLVIVLYHYFFMICRICIFRVQFDSKTDTVCVLILFQLKLFTLEVVFEIDLGKIAVGAPLKQTV